jgi:hypothetical protein
LFYGAVKGLSGGKRQKRLGKSEVGDGFLRTSLGGDEGDVRTSLIALNPGVDEVAQSVAVIVGKPLSLLVRDDSMRCSMSVGMLRWRVGGGQVE